MTFLRDHFYEKMLRAIYIIFLIFRNSDKLDT